MDTFAASEAKNQFGRLLDTAQREPVTITRKRRPVAVLLSKHDYDQIQRELQDARSEAETQLLMRGNNGKRLMESISEARAGNVIVKEMNELTATLDDEG